LSQVNPKVLLRLSFRILQQDIPFIRNLFKRISPEESELTFRTVLGKYWAGIEHYDVFYKQFPHWLAFQNVTLKKLTLKDPWTEPYAYVVGSDSLFILPPLQVLEELSIKGFHPRHTIRSFIPSQFPKLRKLTIDIQSIPWPSTLETVVELSLAQDERNPVPDYVDLGKKLSERFPNVQTLTIKCQSGLLKMAQ